MGPRAIPDPVPIIAHAAHHPPALPARLPLVAPVDQGAADGAGAWRNRTRTCTGGARSCRPRRARRWRCVMRGHRRLAARAHGGGRLARSAASTPPASPSHRLPRRAAQSGGRPGARPGRATSASRPPGTTRPSTSSSAPEYIDELRALERRAAAHRPEQLLRGHRQGRRGARLARDDGALPGRRIELLEGGDHALSDFDAHICTRCWASSTLSELDGAAAHGTIRAMFALFEEAGKFLAGRVMSEAETSAQVELETGKRVKVKAANVLLQFDKPQPAELIARGAGARARDRPRPRLGIRARGRIRLRRPGARLLQRQGRRSTQQAAALLAPVRGAALLPPRRQGPLQEGAGRDRAAGAGRHREEEAGAGADRRLGRASWPPAAARRRSASSCIKILFKPDKNAPEYKAVVEAVARARSARRSTCCKRAGAIDSPYQFHWRRFLFENFPKGTGFPPLPAPRDQGRAAAGRRCRPSRSTIRSTTEIDDALSVQGLGTRHGDGRHPHRRAGPGAAAGSRRSTRWRAQRLSTVYMPGHKITMLPDDVVQAYTLQEGRDCPAVSLYVDLRRSDAGAQGHARRGSSACRSPPTCATTSSTP